MAPFSFLTGMDPSIFFAFQDLRSPFFDLLLGYPTYLGTLGFLIPLGILAIVLRGGPDGFEKAWVLTGVLLISHAVTHLFKLCFQRPRPYELWDHVVPLFGMDTSASFPSGHTASAFAAAYVLNRISGGKMPWLYLVAGWVGITRIYNGMHYPTDVLGGAIVGAICAAILTRFWERIRGAGNRQGQ